MDKRKGKLTGGKRRYARASVLTLMITSMMLFIQCDKTKTITVDSVVEARYQFGDMNGVQLKAAQANGITPLARKKDIGKVKDRLVKISTNDAYIVDRLDYSVPYLTPGASALLKEIGERFQKRLSAGGFRKHRIIVTSVLRTEEDVKRLMNKNGNATQNSCHKYATTFDITYVRFECMSLDGNPIADSKLCNVLGAVLEELRNEGRCYVKFEWNQHCFHITSRR